MLSYSKSTQKVSPGNTKHKRIPHSFGIFLFSEQLYKIPGEADFKVEITLCWVWNSLMLNMKLFMTELQLVCPIVYKTFVHILNSERKLGEFFFLSFQNAKKEGQVAEFLNVTASWSCDRAEFSWVCAKSWEVYAQIIFFAFNPLL